MTNTIRNRVTGAENVGSAPIAVACTMPTLRNGAPNGNANGIRPANVSIYVANGTSSAMSVTCVMLTGAGPYGPSAGAVYSVSRTISVNPGSYNAASFTPADNPTSGATDLGNVLAGVNCTLPPGGIITTVQVNWLADNGVGT